MSWTFLGVQEDPLRPPWLSQGIALTLTLSHAAVEVLINGQSAQHLLVSKFKFPANL